MTSTRVPWHRSLFLRLFGIGALIALVAVIAATWATVQATTVAVRQEQQQSLHAGATTYDALIGYAATHRSWAGARPLVLRLARESGNRVSITDEAGRTLVDSAGSDAPHIPSQARATIDPLSVDTALMGTAALPAPAQTQTPRALPCDTSPSVGCCKCRVPSTSAVDARVVGPFGTPSDKSAWTTLQHRVDTCLRAAGLRPVLALTQKFDAIVNYPQQHTTVAQCVDTGRRVALAPYVAPRALLFIGGGSPTADLFWNLSGHSQVRIVILSGAVLLVTLLLCVLLAGHVVRPLRRMAGAALRAGEGDLAVRVPDRRGDEVGEVARAFNAMADRRQQLEEARQRMVSDVSHELRAPLANVRGWLEAAQDGLAEPDERLLGSLHEETLHLQRLVDDLHDLALGDAGELRPEPETVDLGAFLDQVAEAFWGAAGSAGVTLSAGAEPDATVHADPVRLRQAVANLVANALRHTPPGGQVTLRGANGSIAISDTGEGIAADELPHVFERFRRVDPSRNRATGGSGLGLAIVRQIAEAHGGTVAIASVPGTGTTVTLRLP